MRISSQTTSKESLTSSPTISSTPSPDLEHEQERQYDKIAEDASKVTSASSTSCSSSPCPPSSMSRIQVQRILLPHLLPVSVTLKAAQLTHPHTLSTLFPNIMKRWTKLLSKLLEMGMASEGNQVEVYSCGDASFSAQWAAIEAAHERVYLETFVLTLDNVGRKTIQLLYQAAERGCKVILMYDGGGSVGFGGLNENCLELAQLRAHPNVTVVAFNPLFGIWSRKSGQGLWNRNHRKILIADHVGFGGGMNLTAQYAGPKLGLNQFRDTHMRIEGPAVEHLTQVFLESVREALSRSEWRTVIAEIRAAVPSDRRIIHYLTRSGLSLVRSDSLKIMAQARTAWNQYSPYIIQTAKQLTRAVTQSAKSVGRDVIRQCRRFWRNWTRRSTTQSAIDKALEQIQAESESESQSQSQQQAPPTPRPLAPSDSDSDSPSDSDDDSDSSSTQSASQASPTTQATAPAPSEQASDSVPTEHAPPPAAVPVSPILPTPLSPSASSVATSMQHDVSPILPAQTPLSPYASPVATTTQHDNVFVQIFRSNAIRNGIAIQRSVLETINHCQTQILITNPFFLPRPRVTRALLRAARRGVRISILTQGVSDTPWMRWAAIYLYHRFLHHPNIEIWEYQDRILHAKTITIDGIWSTIGSFNLDYFSSRKALELNIGIVDHDTSCTLQQQFKSDLQSSKHVTLDSLEKRPWCIKMGHWCAYHLAHFIQNLID